MSHEQIIRAWKDSAYRNSLSVEEQAQLPANPAGECLTEDELNRVVGGHGGHHGHGGNGGGGDSESYIAVQSCYTQKYSQNVNQTITQLDTIGYVNIAVLGNANSNGNCNTSASNSTGGTTF